MIRHIFSCFVLSVVVYAIRHDEQFVREVNKRQNSFQAQTYPNINFEAIMMRSSYIQPKAPTSMPIRVHKDITLADLPKNFDSRDKWPQCKSIRNIRDQSHCGDCWAVAAAAAISDRMCIHTNATFNEELSATDIATCCSYCFDDNGCHGGDHFQAWRYWIETGIVTGDSYNMGTGCKPYFLEPCGVKNGTMYKDCSIPTYPPDWKGTTTTWDYPDSPKCDKTCQKGYAKTWDQDKQFGASAYNFYFNDTVSVMYEIMMYGPVETSFNYCEDFLVYKSGIYDPKGCTPHGWHAVKIIGWGEENGVPYWNVANSFDTTWGESGFFRKLRGDSDSDSFMDNVTGGLPLLKQQ